MLLMLLRGAGMTKALGSPAATIDIPQVIPNASTKKVIKEREVVVWVYGFVSMAALLAPFSWDGQMLDSISFWVKRSSELASRAVWIAQQVWGIFQADALPSAASVFSMLTLDHDWLQ